MSVSATTRLRRNEDILHAPVGDDEVVMMNLAAGQYYGVKAVGRRIWELLESPKTVAELAAALQEEFEVDAMTAEVDVMAFVGELVDSGAVHADSA